MQHRNYGLQMNDMMKKHKILLLRLLLGVLILLNMVSIFAFSAQDGTTSGNTSHKVSQIVAENTVKDFDQKTPPEQDAIVKKINLPLRKLAHMAEFGTLGALILLFLLTWKGQILLRYALSLASVLLYACTDELHQHFSKGRHADFADVLIDLAGAAILCTLLLAAVLLWRSRHAKNKPMKVTHYHLSSPRADLRLKLAIASDLHNNPCDSAVESLRREIPDLILIPGDLMDDEQLLDLNSEGYRFLRACASIAPTFYSLGNHEVRCYHKGNPWRHPKPVLPSEEICQCIRQTGVTLLINDALEYNGLTVCGLNSGINGKTNRPDEAVLARFSKTPSPRILLCHHPEYFIPYIKQTDIELTVCGHAHGGQWRLFGRGVYSPGQGLFPKYTSGVLEDRCVISRGMGNHTRIPRICNAPELVVVHWGDASLQTDQNCNVKE